MKSPWVSREQYETALADAAAGRAEDHRTGEARYELLRDTQEKLAKLTAEQMIAEQRRYDTLLEKYHELRATHDAPYTVKLDASEQLGPLTRLALSDMARGQSGLVVRTMRDKALALWLDLRGQENQDEMAAIAVRNGEPL